MLTVNPYPKIEFVEDIETDLICTTIFSNLGAPKGMTGMLDWRLHGFISRNIVDKNLTGQLQESVLMPLDEPFLSKRLFLVGLGSWREYNTHTLKQVLPKMLQTVLHLHPKDCLICIPRLLKESYQDETQSIVSDFFTPLSKQVSVQIQITPLA